MRALLFLLLATPAWAGIHEITSIKEILPHVNAETFLVFDLDNTLIEPVQSYGSDQWFEAMVERFKKQGKTEAEAIEAAVIPWVKIQKVTLVRAIEPTTSEVFAKARTQAKAVMALTARPGELAESTGAQLKGVGINFATSSPVASSLDIGVENEIGKFRRGIFYIGAGKNKGRALMQFFEVSKWRPNRVVFVDDKPHHVKDVEKVLTGTGIEFDGFRYGATDAKVKAFRMDVAEQEAKKFKGLID